MDHEVAVREKMTEKYLLNELDPETRDQFEEHFFDCGECSLDVRAGAELVEQTKVVMAEEQNAVPVPIPVPSPPKPDWFTWLRAAFRPAIAAPAMALLLAVVGYQNLVTVPKLELMSNSPQILRWTSINVSTRGATVPVIVTQPGKDFLLFVNIPLERRYTRYTGDLYNAAGRLEWTLTIPSDSGQDALALQVPGANRAAGIYTLAVRGVTADGETLELGRNSFELQTQK